MDNTRDYSNFDGAEFGEFLIRKAIVPSRQAKFFVHWVRKFFVMRGKWKVAHWFEQVPLFLEALNHSGAVESWQLRQAEQAVRVYFTNYLHEDPDQPVVQSRQLSDDASLSFSDMEQRFVVQLKIRNYSASTLKTYLQWVRQYHHYCNKGDSQEFAQVYNPDTVKNFLAHLAIHKNVAASTQNQAFNSLLMFFRMTLNMELGDLKENVRARSGRKLPVVFSVEEVQRLFACVKDNTGLALKLIYGGGLRVNECCRIRIKDVEFDQRLLFVRSGKGDKDRSTLLPETLVCQLKGHVQEVFSLHDQDLARGFGTVRLPSATPGWRRR